MATWFYTGTAYVNLDAVAVVHEHDGGLGIRLSNGEAVQIDPDREPALLEILRGPAISTRPKVSLETMAAQAKRPQ